MRHSRGFTLLEMMVATLIMAIAIVGLMSNISSSTRNAARLRDYDRVTQLAQLRMNELLVDPKIPYNMILEGEFPAETAGPLKCGWRARLTPFEMLPGATAGDLSVERMELQVWWMSGEQHKMISIEGFRRHTITGKEGPMAVNP